MSTRQKTGFALMVFGLLCFMCAPLFAQCGGSNRVDFGNANLGQQLCAGGNCQASTADNASIRIAEMEALIARMQSAPVVVAGGGGASASSSASTALTQPGGYLTFQEGGYAASTMRPVPEISSGSELAGMRSELEALRAELAMARSARSSMPVFQTAAFQTGGASASSSASTAAPSINALALTAPTPSASSRQQSACSSGGCGGGGRFKLFRGGGGRQVSRSRSFSSTSTR